MTSFLAHRTVAKTAMLHAGDFDDNRKGRLTRLYKLELCCKGYTGCQYGMESHKVPPRNAPFEALCTSGSESAHQSECA